MNWTRKDYMTKKCTHNEYYGQFVTPGILDGVGRLIGVERIKKSTDPHFNDIPLKEWDNLNNFIRHCVGLSISKSNVITCASGTTRGGVSLSDTVCVAKAAARIIAGRA